MKYIVTENELGLIELFIFPQQVHHDCFMESLEVLRTQSYGNWERLYRKPISAAFINKEFECYGSSATLDLNSRPHKDTKLLRNQIWK